MDAEAGFLVAARTPHGEATGSGRLYLVTADLRSAFLSDVADSVRVWERHSLERVGGGVLPPDVIRGALAGLAHSILVILDGGTKVSDHGRVVFLTGPRRELRQ